MPQIDQHASRQYWNENLDPQNLGGKSAGRDLEREWAFYASDEQRFAESRMPPLNSSRCLELGGGLGTHALWLASKGATVTVVESLPGELRLRTFSYTKYLRDSLFFPSPGETLVLQFFEQSFSPLERIVRKTFTGAQTDGAVLRKVNGTWQPWKYAGGSRFFAPNPNDAPANPAPASRARKRRSR